MPHNQSLSDCTSSLHVTSYRPLLPAWFWGSAMNCDLRSFWEICSTGAAATEFNHALLMQAASPNVHEERNQIMQKMDDTPWQRCCSQLNEFENNACEHDLRCSRQCGCATLACARRLLVLCASGMNPNKLTYNGKRVREVCKVGTGNYYQPRRHLTYAGTLHAKTK